MVLLCTRISPVCLGESHTPGPRFNIKMSSYQYRKSHCGDKTVVRSSYLHNGVSYTGKMKSLYWIRALYLSMGNFSFFPMRFLVAVYHLHINNCYISQGRIAHHPSERWAFFFKMMGNMPLAHPQNYPCKLQWQPQIWSFSQCFTPNSMHGVYVTALKFRIFICKHWTPDTW